jgi:hypothetical protein
MTKARRKFDGADNRKDFATAVNPKGLKANGSGHGSIALSNELLARGRAVLVDGALPSTADALCLLGPPFGDGFAAVDRFMNIWAQQPLARSFDARHALDDVSVDDEDLSLLRDVLARDLALAPESARAPIEEAIIQLDLALAWTSGGTNAVRLAGLAACHASRSTDPDERLLAAAVAIVFSAASANRHDFPAYGLFPPRKASESDAVSGFVTTVEEVLRAFADQHLKSHASTAAILATDELERKAIITGEIKALLLTAPERLPFVDSGADGAATFASLMCPGRADAAEATVTERTERFGQDCRSWAANVMVSHSDVIPAVDGLMKLLGNLTVGQGFTVRGLNETMNALDTLSLPDDPDNPLAARLAEVVSLIRLRLHLYAAHLGDPAVAAKIAAWSAGFALANMKRTAGWPMLVAAIGWAERSAIGHPAALSSSRMLCLPKVDDVLDESVASRLDRVAAELAYALCAVTVVREGDTDYGTRSFGGLWRQSTATSAEARRLTAERADAASTTPDVDKDSIVVVRSIAEGKGYSTKEMHAEFKDWVGKAVPLVFTKDVQAVYRKLVAEAPHARPVIDTILRDSAGSRTTAWRPTLLAGKPGSGKTLLAVRICQELGVPHRVFGCGGVSDSSFGGTSRQWSTGRASVPLQTIRRHGVANPAIILDEIEKIGVSRQNGNLVDGLLTMLEPVNSARVFDLYLEGEVDLHRVLWMATANDPAMLHPALLDRFRILEMPDPRPEHLHAILPGVISAVAERRGLSREWITPFDMLEIDMIEDLWRGGSIRRLARIVEAFLDARDNPQRAN